MLAQGCGYRDGSKRDDSTQEGEPIGGSISVGSTWGAGGVVANWEKHQAFGREGERRAMGITTWGATRIRVRGMARNGQRGPWHREQWGQLKAGMLGGGDHVTGNDGGGGMPVREGKH